MAQGGRLLLVLTLTASLVVAPRAQSAPSPQLDDARRLFFNAHYDKAAAARISSVIFIEQKCGPHIEQKCAVLAPSAGSVSSWNARAVTGSSDRLN